MSDKTHYQLLQVDSEASLDVIEVAYRRLAKLHHPDLNKSADASKKMQELNQAYAVLKDQPLRRQYDERLRLNQSTAPKHNSHESYNQQRKDVPPPDFPITCMGCGASDSTLRMVAFPYVISVILMTFRRYNTGVYCTKCRQKQMLKCKLLTFCLGWWGIPWGFVYTLMVLFKPSQGEVPTDVNGDYLKGLGLYFLTKHNLVDAEHAWAASLSYKYDLAVSNVYAEVFGKQPDLSFRNAHGEGAGILFGIGIIAFALFVPPSVASLFSSSSISSNPAPVTVVRPTATFTSVLLPSPSPTVAVIQVSEPSKGVPTGSDDKDGWYQYSSEELMFSAYVPENFIAEEHAPTSESPMQGVSFAPNAQKMGPDSTVISVMFTPAPDTGITYQLSEQDIKGYISDWTTRYKLEIVSPPKKIYSENYLVIEMTHEVPTTNNNYRLRAHVAFVSTPNGFYYIEVAGLTDYDSIVEQYYTLFIQQFQPTT